MIGYFVYVESPDCEEMKKSFLTGPAIVSESLLLDLGDMFDAEIVPIAEVFDIENSAENWERADQIAKHVPPGWNCWAIVVNSQGRSRFIDRVVMVPQ